MTKRTKKPRVVKTVKVDSDELSEELLDKIGEELGEIVSQKVNGFAETFDWGLKISVCDVRVSDEDDED